MVPKVSKYAQFCLAHDIHNAVQYLTTTHMYIWSMLSEAEITDISRNLLLFIGPFNFVLSPKRPNYDDYYYYFCNYLLYLSYNTITAHRANRWYLSKSERHTHAHICVGVGKGHTTVYYNIIAFIDFFLFIIFSPPSPPPTPQYCCCCCCYGLSHASSYFSAVSIRYIRTTCCRYQNFDFLSFSSLTLCVSGLPSILFSIRGKSTWIWFGRHWFYAGFA